MEAITNMCSRIETNVNGVTNHMINLEQRLEKYETQLKDSLNESKIISALNDKNNKDLGNINYNQSNGT